MADTLSSVMDGNMPENLGDALYHISEERGVCMGNLSWKQMESRMRVEFPDDLREYFENNHQDNCQTDLAPEAWHCFDIPFELHVGSMDRARWVYDHLMALDLKVSTFNIRFPIDED